MFSDEKTKISSFLLHWNRETERKNKRSYKCTSKYSRHAYYRQTGMVRLHKQNKFYYYDKRKNTTTSNPILFSFSLPLFFLPHVHYYSGMI